MRPKVRRTGESLWLWLADDGQPLPSCAGGAVAVSAWWTAPA